MRRGNPLLFLCAIGALVLAFGCGRQAFAQSIKDLNNGQFNNGQFKQVPPPNSPVNKTATMGKPFPGKLGNEKLVLPPGGLKFNPQPTQPGNPVPPNAPGGNPKPLPWPPPGTPPTHWHPSFQLQFPMPASGHYETVTETVMLEPEHTEKFWVQPEYQVVTDPSGTPQVVNVKNGYLAERVVPARFATIQRQVWVQDNPGIGFGLGFKF